MKFLFIFIVRVYQLTFSKVMGDQCRFYPSCSEYMLQALKKEPLGRGVWLGVKRLLRCHPFNSGGLDELGDCYASH